VARRGSEARRAARGSPGFAARLWQPLRRRAKANRTTGWSCRSWARHNVAVDVVQTLAAADLARVPPHLRSPRQEQKRKPVSCAQDESSGREEHSPRRYYRVGQARRRAQAVRHSQPAIATRRASGSSPAANLQRAESAESAHGPASAPRPNSTRPALARCPDVASTKAAAVPPRVALLVADRWGDASDTSHSNLRKQQGRSRSAHAHSRARRQFRDLDAEACLRTSMDVEPVR
jgi:hypothetical protein